MKIKILRLKKSVTTPFSFFFNPIALSSILHEKTNGSKRQIFPQKLLKHF
jgi:hypothetical protein